MLIELPINRRTNIVSFIATLGSFITESFQFENGKYDEYNPIGYR